MANKWYKQIISTNYRDPKMGTVRTIVVRRSAADTSIVLSIALNSLPPKGTAVYMTPEEALDLATALQFYAQGLDK